MKAESAQYGLLKYSSQNIGDEIQSVAARRFLPRVDHYVHREQTDTFRNDVPVKLIMNAWWMWRARSFPPSDSIDPLLISIHLRKESRSALLRAPVLEYLRAHGPVGCRDQSTVDVLTADGVPAYLSGCLTLTLRPNPQIARQDFVLVVDAPPGVANVVRRSTDRPVHEITRMQSVAFTAVQRIQVAELFLRLFQTAHSVVSPCLHVVLPCLALGTPVLRIDDGVGQMDAIGRFSGLTGLAHTLATADFVQHPSAYDVGEPPANPRAHRDMAADLTRRCAEFTGYDGEQPAVAAQPDPLVQFFDLLAFDQRVVHRTAWWSRPGRIVPIAAALLTHVRSRHDLTF